MSSFFVLVPVQKQVNHFGVMPREIGCFRFRSLDSCRSRPRPTSVESGASSSHHVMGCAPIEATWLLDRPLSRAMTLILWHLFMDGPLTVHGRRNAAEHGDDRQYQKAQSDLGQAVPLELSDGAPAVALVRQTRREALAVKGRDGEHGDEKADFRQQKAI